MDTEKRRGRGWNMSAEDGELWSGRASVHAVNRGGVPRPSGRWGEGGQGVRLRFGAQALLWRYEAIYSIEIIGYHCWRSGDWWRRICGLSARDLGAGGGHPYHLSTVGFLSWRWGGGAFSATAEPRGRDAVHRSSLRLYVFVPARV